MNPSNTTFLTSAPSSARGPASAGLADVAFSSSFPLSFSTSSASTSLGSRWTGRRAFAIRFAVCSFFTGDLVFFFKVDLLIYCDCTVECV